MNLPEGKTVLITGGNSGIGFEAARFFAKKNNRLILAIRSLEKGEEARKTILNETPTASVSLMHLDLASLESIRKFIAKIKEERIDIDVFYANAGIYRVPFSTLYHGLESHMAVNYASNYYLYEGLKDYFHSLNHQVRWILTSSIVARFVKINDGDLQGEKKYDKARAYQKSKLAVNHLFLYMCEKEEGTNILPLLVHPGVAYTPLIQKAFPGKRFSIAARRFVRAFTHSATKASLCALRLCEIDIQSPCFCGPRGIGHISGYPKIYRLYRGNIKDVDGLIHQIRFDSDCENI